MSQSAVATTLESCLVVVALGGASVAMSPLPFSGDKTGLKPHFISLFRGLPGGIKLPKAQMKELTLS